MSVALARPMPFEPSVGEVGGVFAGIVALLYAIGKGIAWLLNWNDARASTRTAKLDAWEVKLDKRETEFEAKTDARMTTMEHEMTAMGRENRALRTAFQRVAVRLQFFSPNDPALADAERILAQAIPLEPFTPPDMTKRLDEMP